MNTPETRSLDRSLPPEELEWARLLYQRLEDEGSVLLARALHEAVADVLAQRDLALRQRDLADMATKAETERCVKIIEALKVPDDQGSKLDYFHNRDMDNLIAAIRARGATGARSESQP